MEMFFWLKLPNKKFCILATIDTVSLHQTLLSKR